MQEQDLEALARTIIEANRFMALGTADASGTPWVSPVWYAPLSYRDFVWVSRPGTRHSRNLGDRPLVAMTIYDTGEPGSWSAFYMAAVAQRLDDVDDALEAFNRRAHAQGLRPWSRAEITPPGEFRLYRATATDNSFSTTTTPGFPSICRRWFAAYAPDKNRTCARGLGSRPDQ